MKDPVRFIGLVTTALFAAAVWGCSGTAGTTTPGTGGSGVSGTTGHGGTGGGTGGTSTGGTGGTTGRGGTGGSSGGVGGAGGAGGTTGRGGSGGIGGIGTAGAGGSSTGGARGGSGGTAGGGGSSGGGATGGSAAGGTGGAAGTGTGGTAAAGTCTDNMQNGTETGVDCGGSCGACPNYKISNGPNTGDTTGSGCNGGPAFMCVRDMVFSPEFKVAAADDFGSPTNPQFVYGVVGHDKDTGGLDTQSGGNSCCQCYQLIFTTPRDPVSGVAVPKPMIVQAFNTGAGGGKNFDIYMGAGGEGANTAGCSRQYTAYPTIGQPNNGGIRAQSVSQCVGAMNMYSSTSIATMSCQSAIATDCAMLTASNASVQSTTQVSCTESNQVQNLYHLNWNVLAKRIECPANLTRVTGCKLNSQSLPMADPTAVDMNSASGKGFSSGYTTTTMQDCCRPTCAYKGNVTGADSTYKQYYTCDASGNPG
jgi:hypothetical protein